MAPSTEAAAFALSAMLFAVSEGLWSFVLLEPELELVLLDWNMCETFGWAFVTALASVCPATVEAAAVTGAATGAEGAGPVGTGVAVLGAAEAAEVAGTPVTRGDRASKIEAGVDADAAVTAGSGEAAAGAATL